MVDKEETIEVPSVGGRQPRVIGRQILCEILEPRVEEIFQLVHREIQKCGFEDLLASGVVITGGSTLLAGMPELAEEVLGLPVRRGMPRGIGGLVDVVKSPMYATGVGLVVYGARHTDRRLFRIREENVYRKVRGRMREWLEEDSSIRIMDSFEQSKQAAKIRVVGVGGAGCNAINTMIAANLDRVRLHRRQHRHPGAGQQPGGDEDPDRRDPHQGARRRAPIRRWAARPRWRRKDEPSPRRSRARTWSSSPPAWEAAPAPARHRSSPTSPARWGRSPWAW